MHATAGNQKQRFHQDILAITAALLLTCRAAIAGSGEKLTLPRVLPLDIQHAGQKLTTEFDVDADRVYPLEVLFYVRAGNEADLARVEKLAKPDYSNGGDAEMEIPVRVELRAKGGRVLTDQVTKVGTKTGHSATAITHGLGTIRLLPGHYQMNIWNLQDHPEFENIPSAVAVYAQHRGGVFAIPVNKPSADMGALVAQIQDQDMLHHLADLRRLTDNSYFGTKEQLGHMEIFNIPAPVGVWDGCTFWIALHAMSGDFWIQRKCGAGNREVYQRFTQEVVPDSARESTPEEFQNAVLDLQRAETVQGIYDFVFLTPKRCAPSTGKATSNLAAQFRRTYPELVALVKASPLLPSLKKGLIAANAQPLPKSEALELCTISATMLLALMNDKNGQAQVEEMIWVLKQ